MSGSGPIYEYQREVTERLEQALRERDEARAEVERLTKMLDVCSSVHSHNVKLHEERKQLREALCAVAERQREACAERMRLTVDINAEHLCRATPLVTDAKADGGSP